MLYSNFFMFFVFCLFFRLLLIDRLWDGSYKEVRLPVCYMLSFFMGFSLIFGLGLLFCSCL